jgi:UDP-N-acetylmuramate dehydrogenase
MIISENISLKPYNTFGIEAKAKHFVTAKSVDELKELLDLAEFPRKFILGGGSNMLLTQDIDALVIHLDIKGIEIISKSHDSVIVKVSAGENWHEFVLWCLKHDFGGIENLSLIPGNVGSAPIQNIGAYGVELKDVFVSCDAIDVELNTLKTFSNAQCNFEYRSSTFKEENKGKYIITSVTFKLSQGDHVLKTSYGTIKEELRSMQIDTPNIHDISKAIIAIRSSKLPDPKIIGNSGSFFKNPIITIAHYQKLKDNFPDIPSYKVTDDQIKVPAGWLIEKAGFKGKRFGDYGVHDKQALVLVNYDSAKGKDIFNLSKIIQRTIHRIFNINLETEVNII